MTQTISSIRALVGLLCAGAPAAASTTVFATNFESGLPPEFSAPGASIQGVKNGKQIKIVGHGEALGHSLAADPKPVLVELRVGGARYCMGFGGTVKFTAGKKFQAKDSTAADAACPP